MKIGSNKKPVEVGYWYKENEHTVEQRYKLPHGWLLLSEDYGTAFIPFAEDGTGWGPSDSVCLQPVYL